MGLIFKRNSQSKNTSDNNITISTSTDIMFKIGEDLGSIKKSMNFNNTKLNSISKQLKEHNERILRLEYEVQNKKIF